MKITLFKHNRIAYEAALSMLEKTGKAAIIHPTGTGKSFIGFKLCEDFPDKTVCWLSSSEYIFKTQLENLKTASDGYEPENIRFFTYAKLMLMSGDELAKICPDYIILDEFHRCGAKQWGAGVQKLLAAYPAVPILGLSATNIRYLDNRRDMADELFDGNVASEMTLGEAIVRGILNPPKYVLSVFSYQKDLEKYERRVKRAKSKAVRDAAQRYFEALRRALDKADGLDEIFAKHITDKGGKYIVFCSSKEHMDEIIGKVPEWFARVDTAPHIYTAYSDDPETEKSFASFKSDNSDRLKLLFCIDMLNEGVHVEDVSGVILLRTTVSPIIYKQQIGRALSASKKNSAVIFDIVLNIENLYSIGAVEEEMQLTTAYYRSLGLENEIVNEHFKVIDEVHDCIELFEKLNDTLTASWDLMYGEAKQYYKENGDLQVPSRYVTPDGYSLGRWIFNQRNIRSGAIQGSLSGEQIAKLDSIGMIWGAVTDLNWTRNYEAAKAYFEEHGNLNIPARYVTENGLELGAWLASLRTWERAGAHRKYLSAERKKQLDDIGMVWDVLDFYWENNFRAATDYYRENRNLDVPTSYVTKDGIRLGSWIARLRSLRAGRVKRGTPPTAEQIARLDAIGMRWETNVDAKWERGYSDACHYVELFGNLNVPNGYKSESGLVLRQWLQNQRKRYQSGKLEKERKERLDKIGMIWKPDNGWLDRYEAVKRYYAENGTIYISQNYVADGVWLGKWIAMQKKYYKQGKLTPEQRRLLEELPLERIDPKDQAWNAAYEDAAAYFKEHGNLKIPGGYIGQSGVNLADWLVKQRRKHKLGKLSEKQIRQLEEIGFSLSAESRWERGYRYAKAYYEANGHLNMPQSYKTEDGYTLGVWVNSYRNAYNGRKAPLEITEEQIAALEQIGMEWKPESVWDKNYSAVKEFYDLHSKLPQRNAQDKTEKKYFQWLQNQRKSYRLGYLTPEKTAKLKKIGITEEWLAPQKTPFEKGYSVAKAYFDEFGNLDVSTGYQHKSGFWLGSWIDKVRKKRNELTEEQIKLLDEIGFVWDPTDSFEAHFRLAKKYYDVHGCLPLEPKQCKDDNELQICRWLRRQLLKKNEGKLDNERISRLSAIGMDWLNSNERAWERGFSKAKEYSEANGNLDVITGYVCEDGYPLGEWLHSQRTHRNRLTPDKVNALVSIGMTRIQ